MRAAVRVGMGVVLAGLTALSVSAAGIAEAPGGSGAPEASSAGDAGRVAAADSVASSEDYSARFSDYGAMRARVGELYRERGYVEAARILEWGLERFPDRMHANAYNLALMCAPLGELDRGLAALQRTLDRGEWYSRYDFAPAAWDPYRGHAGFVAIQAACEARRVEAQRNATMRYEVVTPEGFDPARRYPLFIALHGGAETVEAFRPHWASPLLAREFIVLFVQSSQVISMTGFTWEDEAMTRRDVGEAYRRASAECPIDAGEVLIGGFSSGGGGSLAVALAAELPIRGFVILCPQIPDSLREPDLTSAAARGLRGTLLTTGMDNRVDAQRAAADRLREAGCDVRFHVTPDEGHWYPANLGELIDEAIGHIRGR